MKLRTLSKNNLNNKRICNETINQPEDFEYLLLLNNLFEQIEIKIEKIKDKIIYEILEINHKPKQHKRSLKRSK
jgi:hypothetical protein